MIQMMDQVRVFRRRRLFALFGLGLGTVFVCFALLNSQQSIAPLAFDWPFGIGGIVIGALAQLKYRCPYCGKFPEKDDILMFNADQCAQCGAKLK